MAEAAPKKSKQDAPLRVDFHTHILPKEIPDWKTQFGYGGFITLEDKTEASANMMRDDGHFFRKIESNCWDPEVRLKEMKATGVDVQVLCTVPVMFAYWAEPKDGLTVAKYLNDDISATCVAFPKNFIGLATLPMQDPALAVEELRRAMALPGMVGVQIGSHIGDWNLDAPELEIFWKTAEELNAAVLVHPWDMQLDGRYKDYWAPWLVGMPAETTLAMVTMLMGGVLEKFPNLRVCFAHGGGSFAFTLGRIEHGYNVRPDLCAQKCKLSPKSFVGKFWVDSAVHDNGALKYLADVVGSDKVVLGSDYPFPLGEPEPGKCVDTNDGFNEQQKAAILSGNALEFLGKSPGEFQ
eukprot:m.17324 g.17324  ORF g.17324 m.17324 type:complete len:352 (+) comp7407_c0_seq2:249-1304(+)